ncbi:MAG TPA: efflux RND transporter permease subunit [Candidatus Saccharimonadales bacterium]|nr:efflux RND transporter permease subunit [Candidatus Saccharimonadales bacterium]
MKKFLKKVYKHDGEDRLLPKFSLFIFDRSRSAAVFWILLTLFGALSYSTFLKREGFPSINIPYAVVGGAYIVNDPQKVDKEVVKPISDIVLKEKEVKSVQSHAQGNSFDVVIQYEEGTNVSSVTKKIEQSIKDSKTLPERASMKFIEPKFGFTERGDDAVISVYATGGKAKSEDLVKYGKDVASFIKQQKIEYVSDASIIDPFITGKDPVTGVEVNTLSKFDRYGLRQSDENKFYDSISVGITQKKGSDVIKFDDKLREAVNKYNQQYGGNGYTAVVSASYAPEIKSQIGELQKALLEGLFAVLLIGSLVIAIRASIITVLSMLTVLAISIGALFLFGYSLNTITLFALILCLGLIVDDTIIMVEALDAQRRRRTDPRETVKEATRKVSRAMVAATSTAALSFAPLLFVGGILGSFIRAIPVTVITALVTSLFVALVFIPLFARYLLLGKKQMGAKNVHEPAAGIEAKIARFISGPMLWARHSKKKLIGVGVSAMIIGGLFIGASLFIFQKVTFNIFPPSKDSNGLMVTLTFDAGTTIEKAEATADKVDAVIAKRLGENFKTASYYESATAQSATMSIKIIPYDERDIPAPELVKQVEKDLKQVEGVQAKVGQEDVGPPASAFTVRVETPDRDKGMKLAKDMNKFLLNKELKRVDGSKAKIVSTSVSDPGTYTRADGKLFVEVTANFNADDTSTLVTLAKTAVEKEFPESRMSSYGLPKDVIKYDFGQEDENQDSFKTLAIAFPLLLVVIYLLLAVQFRSLAQPLLIFMAIPFSLFGITLGLFLSDNAFSFFAMLGFFALIGLSLKNTILLTDYANQMRRQGMPAVDAAVEALGERFRPLIATSLTAIVSLIPLAISSPFWEGLTIVLISGLLSSTFLVIIVFPYYYLGVEYLRLHISRRACLSWIALTVLLTVLLGKTAIGGAAILVALVVSFLAVFTTVRLHRRHRSA